MRAYARQDVVYIFDPLGPVEVAFSPESVPVLISLALQMHDLDEGLRLANELQHAMGQAEQWVAACDGWHPADSVGVPGVWPPDMPEGVRIAE